LELNILLRGQSNAVMFDYFGGPHAVKAEAERLLGFDGVTDKINIIAGYGQEAGNTMHSATAFLTDWLQARGGDWTAGWDIGGLEAQLLQAVAAQPAAQRDDPTAVLWLHNEYDSKEPGLTAAEWESALRFDAAHLRAAFGQDPSQVPYLFVNAIPYDGAQAESNQAIRQAMADLAADPAFNATIAAQSGDLDMNYDGAFGGSHMGQRDAVTLAGRLALSVAQEFAAHARPGSPVALAGGQVNDLGPEVVGVEAVAGSPSQLRLTVDFDAAGGLAPLDATAASGAGWVLQTAGGPVEANAAALAGGDGLILTFDAPVPADGVLHYGYGYGRIVAADGSGAGHAVYDTLGQPVWTPAEGVAVGEEPVVAPADPVAGTAARVNPDALAAGVLGSSAGAAAATGTPAPVDWNAVAAGVLRDAAVTTTANTAVSAAAVDWNALAAEVRAGFTAAGSDTPGMTDWNALAAQVRAGLDAKEGAGTAAAVDWDALAAEVRAGFTAAGSDTPGMVDWNALAAQVRAGLEAPPVTPDWDAIAATVAANYAANGHWYL
jgi:hypothetical protein